MFISFEGIDGSGKSTQARRLAAHLRKTGRDVVVVREPGGTPLAEHLRSILLDPTSEIGAHTELMLFSAARAHLCAHAIAPSLERGAVVIADRFFDSTVAYQGGGRGLADPEWLLDLQHFATQGLTPDRTYWVDVPVTVAAARRGTREVDRMEAGGDDFFERVRAAYAALARLHPERIVRIDGSGVQETTFTTILSDVEQVAPDLLAPADRQ